MPPLPLNTQGRTLRAARTCAGLGHAACAASYQQRSVQWARSLRSLSALRRLRLPRPTPKNGTQNTLIPRALATGNCTLETARDGRAHRTLRVGGRVIGVTYWTEAGERDHAHSDRSSWSSYPAAESRRPGCCSTPSPPMHPNGLGNAHDQVGRNLQGHYYAGACGWMPDPIWDGVGPGATTATIEFQP